MNVDQRLQRALSAVDEEPVRSVADVASNVRASLRRRTQRRVAGGVHVTADRKGQPQVVVRALGANAAARWRVPPVLNITFDELTAGAKQQLGAQQPRFSMNQGHRVLQLIAKSESAA